MNAKPSIITINPEPTPRSLVSHLKGAAGYLGIGTLAHAWLVGPHFDTGSLWSWGYLLAWPIPVLFWLASSILVLVGYALVLIVGCGVFAWGVVEIAEWRERRAFRAHLHRNADVARDREFRQ